MIHQQESFFQPPRRTASCPPQVFRGMVSLPRKIRPAEKSGNLTNDFFVRDRKYGKIHQSYHRDSQRNIPIEKSGDKFRSLEIQFAQGAGMNFTAFFSSTNLGFATKAQKNHGK